MPRIGTLGRDLWLILTNGPREGAKETRLWIYRSLLTQIIAETLQVGASEKRKKARQKEREREREGGDGRERGRLPRVTKGCSKNRVRSPKRVTVRSKRHAFNVNIEISSGRETKLDTICACVRARTEQLEVIPVWDLLVIVRDGSRAVRERNWKSARDSVIVSRDSWRG